MFLNLQNKKITINSYRFATATVTTQKDLLASKGSKQTLTAILDDLASVPIELRCFGGISGYDNSVDDNY